MGSQSRLLETGVLAASPLEAAHALIGVLVVRDDGRAGRIVEVEAYGGAEDPASHAFPSLTPRSEVMAGPPGRLYVYFSYGVHWCANVVCGPSGRAGAVLIRALEPVAGLEAMRAARWRTQRSQVDRDLCRGPGRLAQALGIDSRLAGCDLTASASPLTLRRDHAARPRTVATPRIGVSRGAERPWRIVAEASPWASGPRLGPSRRPRAAEDAAR